MFKPNYQITEKILNNLSVISEVKAIVEHSPLLPTREASLRKTAIIKMAHTSTSIEGNTLNEYQVKKVAEGKKIDATENQIKEVKNYLMALKKIDQINEIKGDFGGQDVLTIHKIVVNSLVDPSKAGAFRQSAVFVVNVEPDGHEDVAYTPPPASKVSQLIDELLVWLKNAKEIHPVIRAGLFHYQFVTIHPFTDGNGRVARLLTLLHLYQSDWDFRKVLVLEDYYNANRKKYYEHLQTATTFKKRENVPLTNWLEYFVEGFRVEAEKLKGQVVSLAAYAPEAFEQQVLDSAELKIVDFVASEGIVTSSQVTTLLKVPKRTVQDKLKKLVEKEVLKKVGQGPKTFYVIASTSD